MLKHNFKYIFLLMLVLSLTACTAAAPAGEAPSEEPAPAGAETRVFTDGVGREVELPADIQHIALSGPLAQNVVFALAPDRIVAAATPWEDAAKPYIDQKYWNLPITGQLYGSFYPLDPEVLISVEPDVVIDIGEAKGSIKEDLDSFQKQTGIPHIFIPGTLETMPEAYRQLGEILNMPDEAEVLSTFCQKALDSADKLASLPANKKVKMLYILGEEGLNVIGRGSFFGEIVDKLAVNLAVVDNPASKSSGNEVDMEQLLLWNPDLIVFEANTVYGKVGSNPDWQRMKAVADGNYYELPFGPYRWMGPSVDRYLGLMWLGSLLYPEQADYDLKAQVTEFFKLFYHCDLTSEQYDGLMRNSISGLTASK
ncbi:MAG: ABC transporter substrate-binding protein [Clostridia bacterium]|nr:ABC transporter substrate-binding protein [Clostridia bacterium]